MQQNHLWETDKVMQQNHQWETGKVMQQNHQWVTNKVMQQNHQWVTNKVMQQNHQWETHKMIQQNDQWETGEVMQQNGQWETSRNHSRCFCHTKRNRNKHPCDHQNTELILGLHPANERRRYKVMLSLIGWTQTYNQSGSNFYHIDACWHIPASMSWIILNSLDPGRFQSNFRLVIF